MSLYLAKLIISRAGDPGTSKISQLPTIRISHDTKESSDMPNEMKGAKEGEELLSKQNGDGVISIDEGKGKSKVKS